MITRRQDLVDRRGTSTTLRALNTAPGFAGSLRLAKELPPCPSMKVPLKYLCLPACISALTLSCRGGDATTGPSPLPTPHTVAVATTRDLGPLTMPATIFGRDGGAAALVGGQIVWAFGDTFITTRAADGSSYRTNTASASPRDNPTATVDSLDSNGVPLPMIAFTPSEQRYNDSTADPNNRIAIWPSHIISNPDGSGTVLYINLYVHPNFNLQGIGIGTAHLAPGNTVATRNPGLLFPFPEPSFEDGGQADGYVYLYGNLRNVSQTAYAVARTPIDQATTRSAYRFWDGATWNADVSKAAKVVDVPGSPTFSFNAFLGSYILVHSALFSNDIVLHTAPSPQGPWSAPITIATGLPAVSGSFDYTGREHPELSRDGGQTIVVSYSRPLGNFRGEVRLTEVTFK